MRRAVMSFQLPSGKRCVGLTRPAAGDYSGRGGVQAITHVLVVPTEDVNRFAGNPFRLLMAAEANGSFDITPPWPRSLPPLLLAGRERLVDRTSLARVHERIGRQPLQYVVSMCVSETPLVLYFSDRADELLSALVSCMPLKNRLGINLASGLQWRSAWPYDWIMVADVDRPFRKLCAERGATLCKLTANGALDIELGSEPQPAARRWSDFVVACLANDQLDALERQLKMMDDAHDFDDPRDPDAHSGNSRSRGDGPHLRRPQPEGKRRPDGPASELPSDVGDDVLHRLELLDDTIFAAIDGDQQAVERALKLWSELEGSIDQGLLEESREQYLRYAITVYENAHDLDQGSPMQAAAAVEIISLLTGAS